jgi:hypothetical protein
VTSLRVLSRSIVDLFVDDELLAVAILAVVALTALSAARAAAGPLASEGILLGGCLAALLAGVWRTARSERRMRSAFESRRQIQ